MAHINDLTSDVVRFRDERAWSQFHNPKDVALSLMLEAAEVLEIFQWQEGPAIATVAKDKKTEIGHELADVLYWTLLMAHDLGIDLSSALQAKLALNAEKYPVDKALGSSRKYTEL